MATNIAYYYNAENPLSWAVSNAFTWNEVEYGETRCSQTFQVSEGSWSVEKVYFKGNRTKLIGPTEGDITVEIRETNEAGALLSSGTLDRTTIVKTPIAWYDIAVSGATLSSGNTYCLVWKCPYGYHNSDTHTYDSIYFINNNEGYASGVGQKYTALDGWEALDTPGDFFFIVTGTAESSLPDKSTNPTPSDSDTEVDFSGLELSWEDGGGADTYNIYIGKTGDLDLVSSTQEGVTYTATLSELATIFGADPINQKIYWRVDATNDAGTTTGDEWNFDPRPGKVDTTTPTHEASGVTLDDTTGSWDAPSDNTDSYDVYYGTLSGFLSLLGNTAELTYSLRSTNWPQYGEAYYWRVDATNDFGTTQGDELNFTTLIFYPPTPSGVTWSDPGNAAGYTGTPLGTNNMLTVRKLCAAAENTFYYESA